MSDDPLYTLPLFWTGFLSVHDAIESLRQIGDIKSCLDKEKLQKDIRLICSKVAELNESWHYQLKRSSVLLSHLSWSNGLNHTPKRHPMGDNVVCFLTGSIPSFWANCLHNFCLLTDETEFSYVITDIKSSFITDNINNRFIVCNLKSQQDYLPFHLNLIHLFLHESTNSND